MKKSIIVALSFLVSLLATACSKSIFTNGVPVTESRPIGNFKSISMHNNVNVRLVQSNQPHLELTCPSNLIDGITTELSTTGDTLIIRNENKFNWLRSYDYDIDLTVYYDSLREVNYASIGRLSCADQDTLRGVYEMQYDTLITNNDTLVNGVFVHIFYLNTNEGSGDINLTFDCDVVKHKFGNGTSCVTFRGNTGYSEHVTRSYGQIHAEDLNSNIVVVESESTNDVYVWAKNDLKAYLYSIGNVYYKGHPQLETTCTNDGRVISLE